jgi:hypothetical protein
VVVPSFRRDWTTAVKNAVRRTATVEIALVHGLDVGRERLADGLLAARGGLASPAEREEPHQDRGQEPEENQVLSHGESLTVGVGTLPSWQDWATDPAAVLSTVKVSDVLYLMAASRLNPCALEKGKPPQRSWRTGGNEPDAAKTSPPVIDVVGRGIKRKRAFRTVPVSYSPGHLVLLTVA